MKVSGFVAIDAKFAGGIITATNTAGLLSRWSYERVATDTSDIDDRPRHRPMGDGVALPRRGAGSEAEEEQARSDNAIVPGCTSTDRPDRHAHLEMQAMLASSEDGADDGASGQREPLQLTVRACVVGVLVGSILCFTNMYFGLQTGWVTMGSVQCAVVGFVIFRTCLPRGAVPFGPHENVVVQTVGVATATMPLAGGFVGIIPALKLLVPPDGPGGIATSAWKQLLWGAALCYFGIFFAVPLRRQV